MFYLSDYISEESIWGVTDTEDNVQEYYTGSDILNIYGDIPIFGVSKGNFTVYCLKETYFSITDIDENENCKVDEIGIFARKFGGSDEYKTIKTYKMKLSQKEKFVKKHGKEIQNLDKFLNSEIKTGDTVRLCLSIKDETIVSADKRPNYDNIRFALENYNTVLGGRSYVFNTYGDLKNFVQQKNLRIENLLVNNPNSIYDYGGCILFVDLGFTFIQVRHIDSFFSRLEEILDECKYEYEKLVYDRKNNCFRGYPPYLPTRTIYLGTTPCKKLVEHGYDSADDMKYHGVCISKYEVGDKADTTYDIAIYDYT